MRRLARLTRLLAAATLVGGGLVAVPLASAAEAATQCSGSEIDSGKTDQGYGTWHLYYSSSSGKNCVKLYVTGRGVGHTRSMYLSIQACSNRSIDSCGRPVVDQGQYHTYSGPVSVTAPHCVSFHYENSIDYSNGLLDADTLGPFHCG